MKINKFGTMAICLLFAVMFGLILRFDTITFIVYMGIAVASEILYFMYGLNKLLYIMSWVVVISVIPMLILSLIWHTADTLDVITTVIMVILSIFNIRDYRKKNKVLVAEPILDGEGV